jgi:hypothetical protein
LRIGNGQNGHVTLATFFEPQFLHMNPLPEWVTRETEVRFLRGVKLALRRYRGKLSHRQQSKHLEPSKCWVAQRL